MQASRFRTLAFAALALFGLAQVASAQNAITVLDFTQQDSLGLKTFNTPSATTTTIVASGAASNGGAVVTLGTLIGTALGSSPITASETLTATSVGAATSANGIISQPFTGTVTFTGISGTFNGSSVAGQNLLTVAFTDLVLSTQGTRTASIQSSQPPFTVTLSSTFTPVANFLAANPNPTSKSFTITMAGLSAPLSIIGTGATATIAGGVTASTESGNVTLIPAPVVPEPGTVALVLSGVPVAGLLWVRRRRRAKGMRSGIAPVARK
jgi:hypothetical protein